MTPCRFAIPQELTIASVMISHGICGGEKGKLLRLIMERKILAKIRKLLRELRLNNKKREFPAFLPQDFIIFEFGGLPDMRFHLRRCNIKKLIFSSKTPQ